MCQAFFDLQMMSTSSTQKAVLGKKPKISVAFFYGVPCLGHSAYIILSNPHSRTVPCATPEETEALGSQVTCSRPVLLFNLVIELEPDGWSYALSQASH